MLEIVGLACKQGIYSLIGSSLGEKRTSLTVPLEKNLIRASWDPKGEKIAAGSGDRTVVVWEAKTGRGTRNNCDHVRNRGFSLQTGYILTDRLIIGREADSWDPKGEKIAAGSGDRTVVVWEAKTGKLLYKLPGRNNCDHVRNRGFSLQTGYILTDRLIIGREADVVDTHSCQLGPQGREDCCRQW
jgi:WD40 repeat protein